ncbi:hypothetical protein SAMN04487891_112172 [Flagellimonas taeanensis]|uniref:Uncharacterized protein n=1 Tax=Flagellimonas taeanensis TaxID=1005926 RepID=A0A1M7C2J9_9FLAO|nr:hypothetical protein SAMN04487891_112172 [Allomuricauda taeanensis]SHL61508.1 hypothetical protein SAMN05216293_3916 [Allomuricauda taeanensis]
MSWLPPKKQKPLKKGLFTLLSGGKRVFFELEKLNVFRGFERCKFMVPPKGALV